MNKLKDIYSCSGLYSSCFWLSQQKFMLKSTNYLSFVIKQRLTCQCKAIAEYVNATSMILALLSCNYMNSTVKCGWESLRTAEKIHFWNWKFLLRFIISASFISSQYIFPICMDYIFRMRPFPIDEFQYVVLTEWCCLKLVGFQVASFFSRSIPFAFRKFSLPTFAYIRLLNWQFRTFHFRCFLHTQPNCSFGCHSLRLD